MKPISTDTRIQTGDPRWDRMIPLIRSFLEKDRLEMTVDGKSVAGYRSPDTRSIWIRDHSDMLRVARYFDEDVSSAVEHFAETQSASGRVFDYFTTFPEKLPCEKENWTKYVRVPVEADVEYRFVKAAYLAWQASGDDGWLQRLLPSLEKALAYIRNHTWRWDPDLGLVKRAYTIDTWDFAYTDGRHPWLQFQITPDTFWGIFHGDNSGTYQAFCIMSMIYEELGDAERAILWKKDAEALKKRMNRTCWNGRFYTHFVKLAPVIIEGVTESTQLSLSNPMAINRGAADHPMALSILNEYRSRRKTSAAFAEWFSIDPPFPGGIFGDKKLKKGAYVNGGIMPLVGGELAMAALEHGMELYGVDILSRYSEMIEKSKASYLWYFPDGTPSSPETSTSPEAVPTDGWGSGAMLWALIGGLAGIQDRSRGFRHIRLAPRWPAAGVNSADIQVTYPASGSRAAYRYTCTPGSIRLHVTGSFTRLEGHILLPRGFTAQRVTVADRSVGFRLNSVESSLYTDFSLDGPDIGQIIIQLKQRERS
jgi:hypothetical protein